MMQRCLSYIELLLEYLVFSDFKAGRSSIRIYYLAIKVKAVFVHQSLFFGHFPLNIFVALVLLLKENLLLKLHLLLLHIQGTLVTRTLRMFLFMLGGKSRTSDLFSANSRLLLKTRHLFAVLGLPHVLELFKVL
jgi:hypothetical protein